MAKHLCACSIYSDSLLNIVLWKQGYYGCATGKAKQAAKTEIEKLKLQDMDIEQLITEAGKM